MTHNRNNGVFPRLVFPLFCVQLDSGFPLSFSFFLLKMNFPLTVTIKLIMFFSLRFPASFTPLPRRGS